MCALGRLFAGESKLLIRESQGGWLLFLAQRLVWPALAFSIQLFGYAPFSPEALRRIAGELPLPQFTLAGIWTISFFLEYVGAGFRLSLRRDWAILELVYVSPFSRAGWILIAAAAQSLGAYLVHLPFLLLASLLSGVPAADLPAVLGITTFIALASIPWGMFTCAVFLLGRNSRFFYAIFETPAEFFSGSRFPLQILPAGVALVGAFYPLAQSTVLFRLVLSGTSASAGWGMPVAAMLATSLLYAVAALVVLRQAERAALTRGDLSYC